MLLVTAEIIQVPHALVNQLQTDKSNDVPVSLFKYLIVYFLDLTFT